MTSAWFRSLGGLLLVGVSLASGSSVSLLGQPSKPGGRPAIKGQAVAPSPQLGRTVARRLNRAEYANAVRDLLAVEIDPAELLPADATLGGFDTVGAVLSLSPLLLERYLSAASAISRLAVGDRTIEPSLASRTYPVSQTVFQDGRIGDAAPFGSRGGVIVRHHFPLDADYVVRITLRRNVLGYVRGLHQPHRLHVRLDGERVGERTIGGDTAGTPAPLGFTGVFLGDPAWEARTLTADHDLTFRLRAVAGSHLMSVTFVDEPLEVEGVLQPPLTGLGLGFSEFSSAPTGPWGPAVEAVSIEGPFSPTGVRETPARRRLFLCRPTGPGDAEACAHRILSSLANRAYRGHAVTADVDRLLDRYRTAPSPAGTFDAGIQAAVERVLVDPKFLFRVERDPDGTTSSPVHAVSDIDLASRLSFFLWSSIPDDGLLSLARRGTLSAPATLDAEVTRLLRDDRAETLVDRFAMQWLGLAELRPAALDSEIFTEYDGTLREAFLEETRRFLLDQLRADHSILDVLSARHTFLNERLARHYGVAGVYGSHFRRVAVGADRAGLLGHGSILTATSTPTRTSPVLRGRWLLDTLFGAPPPPPPPNIPPLPSRVEGNEALTMKHRTERHRRNPACASCHVRMDPLGFSLEEFDAIGRRRAVDEDGAPIDAKATLPDGASFEGVAGLRAYLMKDREVFVRAFTAKLLTYALGRTLAETDEAAVRSIVTGAAADDYRWSAIVGGIVRSPPFRLRQASS